MMRERVIQCVTAAAALAVATVVSGQSTTPQTPSRPAQPTQKDTYGKQQATNDQVDMRRASKCIYAEVRGSDNQKLGDIKDFAIDSHAGRVVFAVISTGGVAGVGDTVRAVPFKALQFTTENEPIKLNIAKASFDQAPTLDEASWDRLSNPEFSSPLYKQYNVQPESATRTAGLTRYVKGTDVVGMDVHNAQDEDLGEVNDIMLNVRNGQIVYAVLGFGGVLGMGEKLFAVPWQALQVDAQDKKFVLNVDKERLRNAPGFDSNNWPDMSDMRWNQDVHAFYGAEPNWIYGYAEQDGGAKSTGWQHDSDYNKRFKVGTTQTITGTVEGLDRVRPMPNMSEAVVLNVRTTDGQTIPIHMGPAWFIDNQSARFNKGEQVTVSGARCDFDGKQIYLASEVRSDKVQLSLRDKDGAPRWDACRPSTGRAPTENNPTPR